jgi:hypothetical protein
LKKKHFLLIDQKKYQNFLVFYFIAKTRKCTCFSKKKMKNWFLYGLVVLQLLWGLFLWVLSLVGIAPGFVNSYTGITDPVNYTWYSIAGAGLALIITFAAWWYSGIRPEEKKKEDFEKTKIRHQRRYFQIARASAGFFLIYAALFGFIGVGVNWVSNYSTITLVRPTNAVPSALSMEYFIVWMASLALYIAFTTYIVYWSIYIFFFGVETGIAYTATKVTSGIGSKASKSKNSDWK